MLQVGSLFSQRAQLEEEEEAKKEQRLRLKEENARQRRLKRRLRESQLKDDPTLVITSSDSEENEIELLDPVVKLSNVIPFALMFS